MHRSKVFLLIFFFITISTPQSIAGLSFLERTQKNIVYQAKLFPLAWPLFFLHGYTPTVWQTLCAKNPLVQVFFYGFANYFISDYFFNAFGGKSKTMAGAARYCMRLMVTAPLATIAQVGCLIGFRDNILQFHDNNIKKLCSVFDDSGNEYEQYKMYRRLPADDKEYFQANACLADLAYRGLFRLANLFTVALLIKVFLPEKFCDDCVLQW